MKSMSKLSLEYFYADKTFSLLKIYLKFVCRADFYVSSPTIGNTPYTAEFLNKLTSIYESSLMNLMLSSNENYTYDLSEFFCCESIDSHVEDIVNDFTCFQSYSLLDFGQQIWDNEFAYNFNDIITILDN